MNCTQELELDIGNVFMTIVVEYDLTEGEPEVRYGDSPQPASPPSIEITEVYVTSVSGATYDLTRFNLYDRGWGGALDRIAFDHVANNEGILEDLMEWAE